MHEGTKTKFYTDVKSPVIAGMRTDKEGDNKLRQIGYDIVRIYFDNANKDCTVGQERIKRVLQD